MNFRPVAGTVQDLVIEVYDLEGWKLDCIDNAGDGEAETINVVGLRQQEERYFRVYTKGEGDYADFEYCNFRLNSKPIALGGGCVEVPPVTFDGSGEADEFLEIGGDEGAIVVSIENTMALGMMNVSFYGNDGFLRSANDNKARYVNRNITIVPTTQPSDTIGVRLYLSNADLQQLISAGAITAAGELDVTKVPAAECSIMYPGGGEKVQFRGAGRFGTGYYVDIGVTGFSEFFLHPAAEQLVSGTSVVENGKAGSLWGVAPNPLSDRPTLTAPDKMEELAVKAEVFDFTGRRISQTPLAPVRQRYLETAHWPRGKYVLVLSGGGERVSIRLVK